MRTINPPTIPPTPPPVAAHPSTPPARFEKTMRTAVLIIGALIACFSIALATEQLDFFNNATPHTTAKPSTFTQQQIPEPTARQPDTSIQDFEAMLKAAADSKDFTGTYEIIDSRTDLEKQIELKLSTTPIIANFVDTPLKEVIKNIGEQLSVAVFLEENSLDEEGIPSDELINAVFAEPLRAEAALKNMLDKLGLTCYVANDMLIFTTETAADECSVVRTYDVRGLGLLKYIHMTQLVNIIMVHTGDEFSWDAVGGVGSITPIPGGVVVSQTHKVHNEIKALLDQFQKFVASPTK